MKDPRYRFPAEKLDAARRALMPPHPSGEAPSYAAAFHECWIGLTDFKDDDLDDTARRLRRIILDAVNLDGVNAIAGRDAWVIKAASMTDAERRTFSRAVDEMAAWLQLKFSGS